MTAPTTAALYVRPSPLALPVEEQLLKLRALAARYGWHPHDFVESDAEASATWEACLRGLRDRDCQVLVVASLDRLGLRLPVLLRVVDELVGIGVRILAVAEAVDTGSSEGRAFADSCRLLLGFERARHVERTRAGMEWARRRGSRVGNQAGSFDKERATALRDRGWGQIRIARELGVGVGRVHRWVKEEYRPAEARRVREGRGAGLPLNEGAAGDSVGEHGQRHVIQEPGAGYGVRKPDGPSRFAARPCFWGRRERGF
jgi:DNA invertase Pin-like site-specific DNA recombinase